MAVSLPTAADVRKIREQARKSAADRAEIARTPLLAFLGAGDYAYSSTVKALTDARTRATETANELPGKLNTDELRKALDDLRAQANKVYAGFAERGEKTWGKILSQPQVKRVVTNVETYSDKLDNQVDGLVDDAHDRTEKALTAVSKQTRSTGERLAQATKRLTGRAAEGVSEASQKAGDTVAEAGATTAEAITEAGDEAASTTRSTTRKAANRTTPADK